MPPLPIGDERIERLGGDERVEQMLAQLAPAQAEAIRARVIQDVPYERIAARLRCSESVVRQGCAGLRARGSPARTRRRREPHGPAGAIAAIGADGVGELVIHSRDGSTERRAFDRLSLYRYIYRYR